MPDKIFMLSAVIHMLAGLVAGICAVSGYLLTGAIIYAIGGYLVYWLGANAGAHYMERHIREEFDKAFNTIKLNQDE